MLFFTIHLFVGSITSGVAVVAALVLGVATLWPLVAAAAVGFLISVPLTWVIVRKIGGAGPPGA